MIFRNWLALRVFNLSIYLYSWIQLQNQKYMKPWIDMIYNIYYEQRINLINKDYKSIITYKYFLKQYSPEDSLKETDILMKMNYKYDKSKIYTHLTIRKEMSCSNYFNYNPIYYSLPIYCDKEPTNVYFINIVYINDKNEYNVDLTYPYYYYINNNVLNRFFFIYYLLNKYPLLKEAEIIRGKLELMDSTCTLHEIILEKDFSIVFHKDTYKICYDDEK